MADRPSRIGEPAPRAIVNVWLPAKGAARDRWLTRSKAAQLLRACWRRELQTRPWGPDDARRPSESAIKLFPAGAA